MHERLKCELRDQRNVNILQRKQRKRGKKYSFSGETDVKEKFDMLNFVIINIKNFQDEFASLTLMHTMIQCIHSNKPLLLQLMRQLVTLVKSDEEQMLIFRPYHRAFGLALFFWADRDLTVIEQEQTRIQLIHGLEMHQEEWE